MKSDTIGKLAEALSKAQGEMECAIKDSSNPFFKSKYADLASVIDALKGPLSKHGLAYVQTTQAGSQGMELITTLMHASGEWIQGSLQLLLMKEDMQGLGSALTYARRYALSSITGITQDDDDGNTAKAKPDMNFKTEMKPKSPPPPFKLQEADRINLANLAKANGYTGQDVFDYLKGKPFLSLNEIEFKELVTHFGGDPKKMRKELEETYQVFEDAVANLGHLKGVK